jgi:hypothetical protein
MAAGSFIGICQAVPCILHLKNRCGEEKFIKMLFLEGYDNLACNKEKKELMLNIEKLLPGVLGSICRPANWRLATATDKDSRQVIKDQTIRKPVEIFPARLGVLELADEVCLL